LSAVLLALALVAAALLAPATQARRPKAELPKEVEGTWADGAATVTCRQVHWTFKNLPDSSKGTVSVVEVLRIDGSTHRTTFSFVGPAGAQTTAIAAPLGPNGITATARWKVGKLSGHLVVHAKLTCGPEASLSVEKLQEIAGSGGLPTTSSLTGLIGQTVDYEVLVLNMGNVPLTLGSFTDPHCDAGTLSGGPGEAALDPEASTTYTCTHLLNEADQSAGSYSNTAEVTGTPPESDGAPITDTSNTVVVRVPRPAFSVEKLQEIAAGGGSYTTSSLSGLVGQTVDYEILVENTGDVPLTLGDFTDPRCDQGTLSGGPGGAPLDPGASTSYTCTHALDQADLSAGSYSSAAAITGTPPPGEGAPITHTSDAVVVKVAPASTPDQEHHEKTPEQATTSPDPPIGSPAPLAESGVLGFTAAGVTSSNAPQGCVRSSLRVNIKAAGVASVTFYLDGHGLKTLTWRNARKGLLTIEIDSAKLKVGAHKLVIRITMAHGASKKATVASRTVRILRCHSAVVNPNFTG
jgi:hypothetical protein